MRQSIALAGILVIAGCLPLRSQASASSPAFEVVSVKPHKPDDTRLGFPQFLPGGRFTATGMPLKIVIAKAYNVGFQSPRLTGGPDWILSRDTVFDIEATPPKDAIPPGLASNIRLERERLMLQALLVGRFHLKIHREMKEMPVYTVTVGKNGPRLQKAKVDEKDCPSLEGRPAAPGEGCHQLIGGRGRGLHGEAVSIGDMLLYVENWSERPMVDQTGLAGLFNVQTRGWQPSQPGPPPPAGAKAEDGSDLADVPTLPAIFESLGLRLKAEKGKSEIFVIDSVEKPSEN
jgi:uncharacterized protein (TIGR03435 family)